MFTTGTPQEGAVNYADSRAVCGTAWTPSQAQNRQNLFLPKDGACAQPIGPKWVSNVTNLLTYAIDAAGLLFGAPNTCQDPRLLWRSILRATPPCLSALTAAGTPPADGEPRAYVDDTVSPSQLYWWNCTTGDYETFSLDPCAADDVGAAIPSGAKMLICDGGELKRADMPTSASFGAMRMIAYRFVQDLGTSATPPTFAHTGPLPVGGYFNNVNAGGAVITWDNTKPHIVHWRGADPAGGSPLPLFEGWEIFHPGVQPANSVGYGFMIVYELA